MFSIFSNSLLKMSNFSLCSGFPGGASGKEPSSKCRRQKRKEIATHSSILAWRISWTEEPGRLQSMGHKDSDRIERLTFLLSLFIHSSLKFFDHFTIITLNFSLVDCLPPLQLFLMLYLVPSFGICSSLLHFA